MFVTKPFGSRKCTLKRPVCWGPPKSLLGMISENELIIIVELELFKWTYFHTYYGCDVYFTSACRVVYMETVHVILVSRRSSFKRRWICSYRGTFYFQICIRCSPLDSKAGTFQTTRIIVARRWVHQLSGFLIKPHCTIRLQRTSQHLLAHFETGRGRIIN